MTAAARLAAAAAAAPVLAAAGVVTLVVTVATAVAGGNSGLGSGVTAVAPAACLHPDPTVMPVAGLSAGQMRNAAIVTRVAMARGVGRSGAVIGVMTAMTESSLIDVDHGDTAGPDSRGLFQQRSSWGPLSVRMDPAGSAGLFFAALAKLPGWQALPPWIAAQAVQRSQFTNGSNYQAHYPTAVAVVNAILGPADPGAGGRAGCGARQPAPTTGSAGVTGGGWGGWANGEIPASALCPLTAAGQLLRCDAAAAWNALAAAYLAATGNSLCITDSYRPLSVQEQLRAEKPGLAAVPGTSNHGWGLAVDLCRPGRRPMTFTDPTYRWLQANAGRFGWTHPGWADPGRGQEEPWHWEYTGTRP